MNIRSVRLKRRAVVISYESNGEEHNITSRDMPLPSFVKAVENLASLVLDVLHLPTDYQKGLKPTGITLTEKQETHLVAIVAQKELTDCNSPFNITTPLRFLSVPQEEGSYSPPLNEKQAALVDAVIREAKDYVKGNRAQGQLPLDAQDDMTDEDDDKAEDEGQDLPGTEEAKKSRKTANK